MSNVKKLTVVVSAHRLDSYRSIEQQAHHQWRHALAEHGKPWRDAGIELLDSRPDTDLVDHRIYRFEATMIAPPLQ
ncbi:hypothetical protein M2284_002660 [Rhodococcus sp. LBL1]|nr:hypothetical protein [Rhodococcus sp. LBL1]MDH6684044.1 hypothetical protein [Rhodococcus sp. LBL2]